MTAAPSPPWSLLILTGGASRRMGRDKSQLEVGGSTMLARLLRGAPVGIPVVVVGPDPGVAHRGVRVTREDPSGGGPAAGIAAGMRLITTDVVVVTAVDLPFAAPALSRLAQLMMAAPRTVDAVVPMVEGRSQPLCAAYRTRPLAAAIQGLGAPAGRSVRDLIAQLTQAAPTWSPQELQDVDSPADLAAVEEALRQQGRQ